MKYQFNKTALQGLYKDLGVRQRALPTLHAKEAALRAELKRVKGKTKEIEENLERTLDAARPVFRLFVEFPDLVSVSAVRTVQRNIAGVRVPEFEGVDFIERPFTLFSRPKWILEGIRLVKTLAEQKIRLKVVREEHRLLEYARRKTTQKVNLYEKVQIPAYEEAIRKIKRFLEDEENLAKSAQKLLKARIAGREGA